MVLLGDSGGGLFATSLLAKLNKAVGVKAMVLINPAADLRNPGKGLYGLVTNWYLNNKNPNDSLVSPLLATDFSSYPPTLIVTSENDELKSQGDSLYEKIKMTNKKNQLFDVPKEGHLGGKWSAAHPDAQPAIDKTVAFILEVAK